MWQKGNIQTLGTFDSVTIASLGNFFPLKTLPTPMKHLSSPKTLLPVEGGNRVATGGRGRRGKGSLHEVWPWSATLVERWVASQQI